MDEITLMHGDCREILPTLEPGSVAAIVTDPPYGTQADKDGYGRRPEDTRIGRFIKNDSDLSVLDGMLGQAGRVLAPNAWLAVFCSPKRHSETAALLDQHGFPVGGEVVWDKAAPGLGGGIRYQHETILLSRRGNVTGRCSMFSVLRHFLSREDKHRRHPHEKPVPLLSELVRYCSEEGQTVLDPFAGSGSTLVACMKTGRRCIGIEIDEQYIDPARRRLRKAETPLFAFNDHQGPTS